MNDSYLFDTFLQEASEHLNIIENELLNIEKNQEISEHTFNVIFREIHSLKGTAGINKFYVLQKYCHIFETLLQENIEITKKIEVLFKLFDNISKLINYIKNYKTDIDFVENDNIEEFFNSYYNKPIEDNSNIQELEEYKAKYPILEYLLNQLPKEIIDLLKEYEILRLVDIYENRTNLYLLKIFLKNDILKNDILIKDNFFKFFDYLKEVGEILVITVIYDSLPNLENLKLNELDIPILILYNTKISIKELSSKLNIDNNKITPIELSKPIQGSSKGDNFLKVRDNISTIITSETEEIEVLISVIDNQFYAIPLDNIQEIYRANLNEIYFINKMPVIKIRNNIVPIVSLNSSENQNNKLYIVVILTNYKELIGVKVDKIIGQEKVKIFKFYSPIKDTDYIIGSCILKSNDIALVIDVNMLHN